MLRGNANRSESAGRFCLHRGSNIEYLNILLFAKEAINKDEVLWSQ